jgi:hypothetical protein
VAEGQKHTPTPETGDENGVNAAGDVVRPGTGVVRPGTGVVAPRGRFGVQRGRAVVGGGREGQRRGAGDRTRAWSDPRGASKIELKPVKADLPRQAGRPKSKKKRGQGRAGRAADLGLRRPRSVEGLAPESPAPTFVPPAPRPPHHARPLHRHRGAAPRHLRRLRWTETPFRRLRRCRLRPCRAPPPAPVEPPPASDVVRPTSAKAGKAVAPQAACDPTHHPRPPTPTPPAAGPGRAHDTRPPASPPPPSHRPRPRAAAPTVTPPPSAPPNPATDVRRPGRPKPPPAATFPAGHRRPPAPRPGGALGQPPVGPPPQVGPPPRPGRHPRPGRRRPPPPRCRHGGRTPARTSGAARLAVPATRLRPGRHRHRPTGWRPARLWRPSPSAPVTSTGRAQPGSRRTSTSRRPRRGRGAARR